MHSHTRLRFTKAESVSVCVWTEAMRGPMSLSVYNACCFDHARRAWVTTLVIWAMHATSIMQHYRECVHAVASQMFRVPLQTEVQLSTFSCRVDERTPFYGHDARWRERLRRPQSARSCRPARARSHQKAQIHQRPHAHEPARCSLEFVQPRQLKATA
jgi:hypothetical protein